MTETQEEPPQQLSIQARIAALKLDQVGKNPSTKQPPPLPSKPPANRAVSAAVLPTIGSDIGNEPNGDILPPLPRRNGKPPPPSLPPRRESENPSLPPRRPELNKKASQESVSSVLSSVSAMSNGTTRTGHSRQSMDNGRVRAPVYDPNSLPPLPPSRRGQDKDSNEQTNVTRPPHRPGSSKSTTSVSSRETAPLSPNIPSLPQRPSNPTSPSLPTRNSISTSPALPGRPSMPTLPQRSQPSEPPLPTRRLPPTIIPPVNARTPGLPQRPANQTNGTGVPPPIPAATRPDLSKLLATKPKPSIAPVTSSRHSVTAVAPQVNGTANLNDCLSCRDFSGPDSHAAKFPRQDVPYMSWLAEQLTAPFPSHTDKARAIFAWLHYNIDYDVDAFFNNNIQPSTPAGTIDSGLAVCEGYAGLFAALATTAGMEAIVVGGHGKGYGYQPLKAGEACPPKNFNHAWNAVKIDGGEWKLLDPCWGAGSVCTGKYTRRFNPTEFTKSNADFGLKHFPNDSKYFYRGDGRTPSWEEYYVGDAGGEPVHIFGDFDEGFSHTSLSPKQLHVSRNPSAHMGPTTRFQFQRVCEHWDPTRNGRGKPFVYILSIGKDNSNLIPFENDGRYWWVDLPISKLGAPGDEIQLCAVDTVGGHSARGMSKDEWLLAKGRKAMSWKGCARWTVSA